MKDLRANHVWLYGQEVGDIGGMWSMELHSSRSSKEVLSLHG